MARSSKSLSSTPDSSMVLEAEGRRESQVLRKANDIIAPRVSRGGTLSLLSRKVFNVLLYHVQRLGAPGVDAPGDDPVFQSLYWLPLAELAKDSAFNSEDTALIKETLLKLQDIKIITDDAKGFSSDVLIGSVKIIPGGRRGRTMVGWSLHPATDAILRSPELYTRLSLLYLTSLRTSGAIALYEICKRYATNPSGLTRREPWEWWYEVLSGSPISAEKPEYKYFKRDTLKPAIAEVATTDISIELIEHKVGRRVVDLQFSLGRQSQLTLASAPAPVIDTDLLNRIVNLGVSPRDAEDMLAQHELEMLTRTVDLVEQRMRDANQPRLNSPAAYLRTALTRRFIDAEAPKRVSAPKAALAAPKPKKAEITPEQLQMQAARAEALDTFDALQVEEKAEKFEAFLNEHPALRSSARKRPDGRVVREALAYWLLQNQSN